MSVAVEGSAIDDDGALISQRQLRSLLPVSDQTIWRWRCKPEYSSMGFPKPRTIGGQLYWNRAEFLNWLASYTSQPRRSPTKAA